MVRSLVALILRRVLTLLFPLRSNESLQAEVMDERLRLGEAAGEAELESTQIYTRIRPPRLKRAVAFYEARAQRIAHEVRWVKSKQDVRSGLEDLRGCPQIREFES